MAVRNLVSQMLLFVIKHDGERLVKNATFHDMSLQALSDVWPGMQSNALSESLNKP